MEDEDNEYIGRRRRRGERVYTSTPKPKDRNGRRYLDEVEELTNLSKIHRRQIAFLKDDDDGHDAEDNLNSQKSNKPKLHVAYNTDSKRIARGPGNVDDWDGFLEDFIGQTYCERIRGTRGRATRQPRASRVQPDSRVYMDEKERELDNNAEKCASSLRKTTDRGLNLSKATSCVSIVRGKAAKFGHTMGLTQRERELMREEEELEKEVKRRYKVWRQREKRIKRREQRIDYLRGLLAIFPADDMDEEETRETESEEKKTEDFAREMGTLLAGTATERFI